MERVVQLEAEDGLEEVLDVEGAMEAVRQPMNMRRSTGGWK